MSDLIQRLKIANASLCLEAAHRIQALENAILMAREMRASQIRYFRDRSKENLLASKDLERAFDRRAVAVLGDDP